MIVNSLTSIGASFIIAFYFSWKLTLVIMCFLPLIGLSGVFQAKMMTGFESDNNKSMEEAGQVRPKKLENYAFFLRNKGLSLRSYLSVVGIQ